MYLFTVVKIISLILKISIIFFPSGKNKCADEDARGLDKALAAETEIGSGVDEQARRRAAKI